ncbi:hypothetical protein [Kitasatospora sp. GP82]|nr:hypothetical protein [Kitasatospora sp. GP82]MDH6128578.1 hypothetical protein [Kitasatospora sp. GP82]
MSERSERTTRGCALRGALAEFCEESALSERIIEGCALSEANSERSEVDA